MDDVAAAIADPVRRGILEMLRERPLAARRIAAGFAISRPAVSRHLRVLRESGLVSDDLVGRERVYHLNAAGLAELRDWIDGFADRRAAFFEQRLDALGTEVHRTRRDRRAETGNHDVRDRRRGGAVAGNHEETA